MAQHSIPQLLAEAKNALTAGDRKQAADLVKQALSLDYLDIRIWNFLYKDVYQSTDSFEIFQRKFTQKFFPAKLDSLPHTAAAQAPMTAPTAAPAAPQKQPPAQPAIQVNPAAVPPTVPTQAPLAVGTAAKPSPKLSAGCLGSIGLVVVTSLMSASMCSGSGENPSNYMVGLILGFWAGCGYVGAAWLTKKGYFRELAGCIILAGGTPLLLPAMLGPALLVAGFYLPDKIAQLRTQQEFVEAYMQQVQQQGS